MIIHGHNFCPECGHDQPRLLGTLGDTAHFRCRACGMGFEREIEFGGACEYCEGTGRLPEVFTQPSVACEACIGSGEAAHFRTGDLR